MKLALPSKNNMIDDHFGHCDYFTVVTLDKDLKKVIEQQIVESPNACGCKSNIATQLSEMGVELMLAGNMGAGAVNKLKASGIDVLRGCSGDINSVLDKWLSGDLKDSSVTCISHDCHKD